MTDKDTITLPREVVKFVLQHLEWWSDDEPQEKEAIEVLRTALAAPKQEPEPGLAELARQMKPLDADMAAILQDNLDSLYIEDEPTLAAEQPKHDLMKWAKDAGSSPEDLERFATYTIATRDMEIATLREENEALRRDAERYRWLREKDGIAVDVTVFGSMEANLDAAIDAAMGDKT